MEAIVLSSGRRINPSCEHFYDEYQTAWSIERGYIAKNFYTSPLTERLDIFELYLEYYFRQLYESYLNNDNKLVLSNVDDNGARLIMISSIDGSCTKFGIIVARDKWGIDSIQLAIFDDISTFFNYHAAIGFVSSDFLKNVYLEEWVIGRIKRVCQKITNSDSEMAAWFMLQGINLISDATFFTGSHPGGII